MVTAQRTETTLQRTPIAVTAFSGEALRQRGSTTLLDIGAFTPNLTISTRSGQGSTAGGFAIRGMGVDAPGSSAAVGVYVDDVYFTSLSGNLLGLLDVDRVEVLRGPQGTLFGRNTIAGAVQYITVKPTKTLGGFVEAIGGNQGRANLQGAINVPLGDTLAARLSFLSNSVSGYVVDDLSGKKRGADRTQAARLQLRWTPTERATLDLKGEILRDRQNGRAVQITAVNPNAQFPVLAQFLTAPPPVRALFGEPRPLDGRYVTTREYHLAGLNAPDFFKFDYSEAQATATFRLTDAITLKSVTAYMRTRSRTVSDLDNTPLAILAVDRGQITDETFSQELQLSGQALSQRLRWTVGGYYYDNDYTNVNFFIALGRAPPSPGGDSQVKTRSKAGYGQITYNLTEKLSGTVGLRYSSETTRGRSLNPDTPFGEATFTDTSPHFGVNYQANADTLLYVKASKGFRAGGGTFNPGVPGGVLPFGPETAWTYEAGARLQLLDRRLRINPTVFWTDWKNIQFNAILISPAGVPLVAVQNAGDARIRGVELESQFAVTDRLLLTGSLSTLDANYKRVSLPPTKLTLDADLQQAPKWKYSLGGRYTQPVGGGRVVASLDWAWTDAYESAVTLDNSVRVPSHGLLSGRLQYQPSGGRWSVALYGTNLLNEYYLLGGVDFAKAQTTGTREIDPGRPREYGVVLRAAF